MLERPHKALRMLGGWAGRVAHRRRPRGLILVYHRIAPPAVDPWNLCVSPTHFREQLAALPRHADVVPLADLPDAVRASRADRPPVAITFDDGYVDNLEEAAPALAAASVPATLFLATGSIGRGEPFWWDALAWLLLSTPTLPPALELPMPDGTVVRWRAASPARADRRRLYHRLWTRLWQHDEAARRLVLDALAGWSGAARDPAAGRPMDATEVRDLVATGAFEVGAHTVSHRPLPALPPEQREAEIVGSLDACAELTGERPRCFSYPHGRADALTIELTRRAGVQLACTGQEALVTEGLDPLALPRVDVHDWSGPRFERWLRWYWLP
jgi:peptidoglycan/xylan/chitin deacetylase (PgdA/CDA1 family)